MYVGNSQANDFGPVNQIVLDGTAVRLGRRCRDPCCEMPRSEPRARCCL
jgi:hypothetical protein